MYFWLCKAVAICCTQYCDSICSSCSQIRWDPWGEEPLRGPHILFVYCSCILFGWKLVTVHVCVCARVHVCMAYCRYTIKCQITTFNETYLCIMSISIYNLLVWANTQFSRAGRLACSACEVTTGGFCFVSSAYSLLPFSFLIKTFLVTKTSYIAIDIYRILSRALKKFPVNDCIY
jgi:hypothetical protein